MMNNHKETSFGGAIESGLDKSLLELRCWPLHEFTDDITHGILLLLVAGSSITESKWNNPADGVLSEELISLIADKLGDDDLSGLSELKLEDSEREFGLAYLRRLISLSSFDFNFDVWVCCWLEVSLQVALWASRMNSSWSFCACRCCISVCRVWRFSSNPSVS